MSFLKVLPPISLQSLRGLPGLAGWEGSACPGADGASRGDSRCHLPAAWQWQCSGHSPLLAGHRNMSWGWVTVPGLCRLPNPLIFLSFGAMFRKASAPAVYSWWGLVFCCFFLANRESACKLWWCSLKYHERKDLCAISKHAQGFCNEPSRKRRAEVQAACQESTKAHWESIPSSILLQLLQEWIWAPNQRNVLSFS